MRSLDHYMQEISESDGCSQTLNIHFSLCISPKLYKLQVVSNWTLGSGDGGNTTASASGESSLGDFGNVNPVSLRLHHK